MVDEFVVDEFRVLEFGFGVLEFGFGVLEFGFGAFMEGH
jgi:hypothetical protein